MHVCKNGKIIGAFYSAKITHLSSVPLIRCISGKRVRNCLGRKCHKKVPGEALRSERKEN